MDDVIPILPQSNAHCAACYASVTDNDVYCANCGYPLKGTEKDQKYFISIRESKEIDLHTANKKIRRAAYILYLIAGVTTISALIIYFTSKNYEMKVSVLIANLILAAIYTVLGLWSKKKPLTSIISGSALYVLLVLLNAIRNPSTIVNGLIFKIFFVACFITAIKSAIQAERIKKELDVE